jgi:hypothetical protein
MRGCLAVLLFLIFFPLALAGLTLAAISTWALDRNFYTGLLSDQRLYEALLSEGATLSVTPRSNSARDVQDAQTSVAFSQAIKEVLTAEYLTATATGLVDQVFTFLDNPSTGLSATVDLRPIKAALAGERGAAFARTLAQQLPACTTGPSVTAVFGVSFPSCRPEGVSVGALESQVLPLVPQLAKALPDQQRLADNPIEAGELPASSVLNGLTVGAITTLAIAGLFWLLIGVAGGTDRRMFWLWLGLTLMWPALLVALVGLGAVTGVVDGTLQASIAQGFADSGVANNAQTQGILTDLVLRAVGRVGNGFLIVGGIALLIAIVITVIGAMTKTRKRKEVYA